MIKCDSHMIHLTCEQCESRLYHMNPDTNVEGRRLLHSKIDADLCKFNLLVNHASRGLVSYIYICAYTIIGLLIACSYIYMSLIIVICFREGWWEKQLTGAIQLSCSVSGENVCCKNLRNPWLGILMREIHQLKGVGIHNRQGVYIFSYTSIQDIISPFMGDQRYIYKGGYIYLDVGEGQMIRLSTLVLYTCVIRVLGIPYITCRGEQNNHEYGRRLSLWIVCSQADVCACQHDIICYIQKLWLDL